MCYNTTYNTTSIGWAPYSMCCWTPCSVCAAIPHTIPHRLSTPEIWSASARRTKSCKVILVTYSLPYIGQRDDENHWNPYYWMITSFGFKNCTPFSSERPNVLRLNRHGKKAFSLTHPHWLFHLALLFTQRQYAMVSEKSSNKKVSVIWFLIARCPYWHIWRLITL